MGLLKKGNEDGSQGARKSARPERVNYVHLRDTNLSAAPVMASNMVSSQSCEEPVKKKGNHKGLKTAGIIFGIAAVAAGCTYGAFSYYYSNRFFEGTTINGIDASGKTAYDVEQEIASAVEDYSIRVSSRNLEDQTIDGTAINYKYASDGEVLALLKSQKPYEWIRGYFQKTNYTTETKATYDKTLLKEQVKALQCAQEENQVAPENAYVSFQGDAFEIIPETEGSELLIKEAYKALDEAIAGDSTSIDFGSAPDVYAEAELTSDSEILHETLDAYNNMANASITYTFGDEQVVLDGSTIKDWLPLDEKGQLVQNDSSFRQKAADFVAQLAADHDTVRTDRPFHTTSGRTVYVFGSAYGWQIDQAAETSQLIKDISEGVRTTREPIYSMTANSHGYNDFGDTYIEVDMSWQHMYYYQNGEIIFDSDIVSGNMAYYDRQTPPGVFTLYSKQSPAVLRGGSNGAGGFGYEQPVTYWMPFNGGIGFHDASWQPYFGGERYLYGGSHGCINLPYYSAAALYDIIDYGVPIICFY